MVYSSGGPGVLVALVVRGATGLGPDLKVVVEVVPSLRGARSARKGRCRGSRGRGEAPVHVALAVGAPDGRPVAP